MFTNYEYFLVLAEELNMTKAAEKLFISHQSLSKYLINLEKQYDITFFHRKPKLSLTYAGELMYQALRKTELIESNLKSKIEDVNHGQLGELRIGTTEGRLRILMPDFMCKFKKQYPNVHLQITGNRTNEILEMLLNNKLDIAMVSSCKHEHLIEYDRVLNENLHLVISDNLLKKYFPNEYPKCKEVFNNGVDLHLFKDVPFIMNYPSFASRSMLDRHLLKIGLSLNCIDESTAMDLHYRMTSRDYAASFCLTMYIPEILKSSSSYSTTSSLNVFPIAGLEEAHPFSIVYLKKRAFPEYVYEAINTIKTICQSYNS